MKLKTLAWVIGAIVLVVVAIIIIILEMMGPLACLVTGFQMGCPWQSTSGTVQTASSQSGAQPQQGFTDTVLIQSFTGKQMQIVSNVLSTDRQNVVSATGNTGEAFGTVNNATNITVKSNYSVLLNDLNSHLSLSTINALLNQTTVFKKDGAEFLYAAQQNGIDPALLYAIVMESTNGGSENLPSTSPDPLACPPGRVQSAVLTNNPIDCAAAQIAQTINNGGTKINDLLAVYNTNHDANWTQNVTNDLLVAGANIGSNSVSSAGADTDQAIVALGAPVQADFKATLLMNKEDFTSGNFSNLNAKQYNIKNIEEEWALAKNQIDTYCTQGVAGSDCRVHPNWSDSDWLMSIERDSVICYYLGNVNESGLNAGFSTGGACDALALPGSHSPASADFIPNKYQGVAVQTYTQTDVTYSCNAPPPTTQQPSTTGSSTSASSVGTSSSGASSSGTSKLTGPTLQSGNEKASPNTASVTTAAAPQPTPAAPGSQQMTYADGDAANGQLLSEVLISPRPMCEYGYTTHQSAPQAVLSYPSITNDLLNDYAPFSFLSANNYTDDVQNVLTMFSQPNTSVTGSTFIGGASAPVGSTQIVVDGVLYTVPAPNFRGSTPAEVAQATNDLNQAFAITGVNAKEWMPGMLAIAEYESGDNPLAVASVGVYYYVAGECTASTSTNVCYFPQGMFQVMTPTFNEYITGPLSMYNNIFNPVDNAIASIEYIKARYGIPYKIRGVGDGQPYTGY